MARLEERLEGGEGGMKAEVAVEVEHAVFTGGLAGGGEADGRAVRGIVRVAVGDDHGEAVDGAALEDADEDLVPGGGGAEVGGPGGLAEKLRTPERTGAEGDEAEGALFEEDAAV